MYILVQKQQQHQPVVTSFRWKNKYQPDYHIISILVTKYVYKCVGTYTYYLHK